MDERGRQDRSEQEQLDLLKRYDALPTMNQSQAALQLKIPRSTLGKVLKRRNSLTPGSSQKRKRTGQSPAVDAAVMGWLRDVREKDASINGPIVMAKAKHFAKQLGDDKFSGSDGWMSRFKKREQLHFQALHGEAAAADLPAKEEWLAKWPEVAEGYEECEIWNADETSLYFRALPDRTIVLKDESKKSGGKKSKERVTVLFAVSLTGDKKKPFVIGKSRMPRCFKEVTNLPVDYVANKCAWMTCDLFCKWLLDWEKQLRRSKKKILLLIDNCSAHKHDSIKDELQALKVVFLPPNTTSILQPLDQGIIRSFKAHFRRKMVERVLDIMEDDPAGNASAIAKKITLLDGILLADMAWRAVKSEGITNCWRKGGLAIQAPPPEEETQAASVDETEQLVPHGWLAEDWAAAVDLDKDLETEQPITEADVIENVMDKFGLHDENENNEAEMEEEVPPPSRHEMLAAMATLRKGLFFRNVDEWSLLSKLDDAVERATKKEVKQSKIEDFF